MKCTYIYVDIMNRHNLFEQEQKRHLGPVNRNITVGGGGGSGCLKQFAQVIMSLVTLTPEEMFFFYFSGNWPEKH